MRHHLLLLLLLQNPAPPPSEASPVYTLAPDDKIMITALDAEEVTTKVPLRIDPKGNIALPLVGRIHAAGLTTEQLEEAIEAQLKKYLQEPDVSVYLVEMRPQPVSVLGAVQVPGVQQILGKKTLYEVISMAGGIRQDAGYEIKLTRRLEWGRIPLPNAANDPSGQYSIASINIKSVMDAANPAENIEVKPNDVISVPKGEIVYVIGSVHKPGGFVMGEKQNVSALQILALAEGLDRFADTKKSRIMRPVPNSELRTEIPIDLKLILDGKAQDMKLQANDVLFIPRSGKKAAAVRGMEAALGMGTQVGAGLAIYR